MNATCCWRALLLAGVIMAGCQGEMPSASDANPRLELLSGDGQTAEVGATLTPAVRALLAGKPLKGVAVRWSADGSALVDEVTRTDALGQATANWALGTRPGPYHLTIGGVGTTTLTLTATARVGALARVRLSPDSGALSSVRDSLQLRVLPLDRFGNAVEMPPVSWSSLDPTIASVGSTGLVRGVAGGTARVVARAVNLADTALVRVLQLPWQLTLTPRLDSLRWLQGTLTLQARVRDLYGNDMPAVPITWSSLTPAIVKVSSGGVVTSLANGTGRVVAKTGAIADTATVVVSQVVEGIWVNPIAATVVVGDSVRLTATTHDRNRYFVPTFPAEWVSNNEGVATVSAGTGAGIGWVKGVSTGAATVRVFSTGGVFATANITVVAAPTP